MKPYGNAALISILLSCLGIGCVRLAYLPPEEIDWYDKRAVKAIEVPIAIVGLELKSGEVIEFDAPTALYSGESRAIVGRDARGKAISVSLDSVSTMMLRRIDRPIEESYAVAAVEFLPESVGRRTTVCDDVLYPMKDLLRFEHFGVYDSLHHSIIGVTTRGDSLNTGVRSVSRAAIEKMTLSRNDKGPAHERYIATPKKHWTSGLKYVPVDEAKLKHQTAVESVEIPVAIESFELVTGAVISCVGPSACFDQKRKLWCALDSTGDSLHLSVDSVTFVGIRRIDKPPSALVLIPAKAFLTEMRGEVRLFGNRRYPSVERVRFDSNCGVYDTLYREISGRARDSSIVCVRFDQVWKVGVWRFSLGNTIGKTVVIGGLSFALAALAMNQAFKNADWDWNY